MIMKNSEKCLIARAAKDKFPAQTGKAIVAVHMCFTQRLDPKLLQHQRVLPQHSSSSVNTEISYSVILGDDFCNASCLLTCCFGLCAHKIPQYICSTIYTNTVESL